VIRGTTRLAGVFGYPVRHSASPAMHNAAFAALELDWAYVPFEVAPENIGAALAGVRALGMAGVNVTVPLKELAPQHLDALTDRAAALQAVNTVVYRDGRLLGDSTDGPGFLAALEYAGFTVGPGMRAVVLGAGGSARAVVLALLDAGVSVVVANRSEERALALAAQLSVAGAAGTLTLAPLTEAAVGAALRGAALLVNTTSVGMHPNGDGMPPVPSEALTAGMFVSDLIYNPAETRLLNLARSRGCRTQNGVEMLVRQGALAFSQWTGVEEPPLGVMREAVLSSLGLPTERP
jgi:shikimate dehydrogenase